MAALATGLCAAACGSGGPAQNAGQPSGKFPVEVSAVSFPSSQQLSEHTRLTISVRNAGRKAIPDIAVTITDPPYGTSAQSFGTLVQNSGPGQPPLASRSRPIWIIDQPPGPCQYSCHQGGPGGAVTADSNTWALGRLAPGHTAKFTWAVTAVQPGTYRVRYQVAAGLYGRQAVAVKSGPRPLSGTLQVKITHAPRQAYVDNNGQIVYTK
jgi:hypothetical protein